MPGPRTSIRSQASRLQSITDQLRSIGISILDRRFHSEYYALPTAKCTTSASSTRFCRSLGILRHGPRLRGFRVPFRLHAQLGLLRRPHQIPHFASVPLFPSGGQDYRRSIRSHRHSDLVILTALDSAKAYPDRLNPSLPLFQSDSTAQSRASWPYPCVAHQK
jgi:hypothetical protein